MTRQVLLWIEAWLDTSTVRAYPKLYVLLLCHLHDKTYQILDPQLDMKEVNRFSTYEEAYEWLREDEYAQISGRLVP